MSEQPQVVITGKDGVSRIFQEISKQAKAAGNAVESAGKEGGNAFAELEAEAKAVARSMQESAKVAEKSVKDVGAASRQSSVDMDKFGAAVIAVGAGLAYAGNAALDQEQTIIGLRSAYGDAADEMLRFADEMASTTIFNDDDIMRGERYFATLRNNYDLAIQDIQRLMQTTADLASAYGTSFEDASSRVTAAIRGEGEAAEYLGLTMNQQAIDRENLTLTMTNQEAAQFRLNALYQQTGVYQGTAQTLLESEVGQRARLTNMIQDNAQALGQFIGPYGSFVGGLGLGITGLAQFSGGLRTVAAGLNTATAASLRFIATPLGATTVAVGAGLAILTKHWMDNRQEAAETAQAWEDATASAEGLNDQIKQMALFNWTDANWASTMAERVLGEFNWLEQELERIANTKLSDSNWLNDMIRDEMGQDIELWRMNDRRKEMIDAMVPTPEDRQRFTDAMSDILSLQGVIGDTHFDAIQSEVTRLFNAFNAADGAITIDQFNAQLERLYKNNLQAAQAIDSTTIATNALASAQQTASDLGADSIFATSEAYTELNSQVEQVTDNTEQLAEIEKQRAENNERYRQSQDEWWQEVQSITEQEDEAARQRAERRREEAEALEKITQMEGRLGHDRVRAINEAKDAYLDLLDAQLESNAALVTSLMGLDDPLNQLNATSHATAFSELAAEVIGAGNALDTVFRVVVGNTNAIAQQTNSVQSWIDNLMTWSDEQLNIHNLVAEGYIGQTQYNDALEAQGRITEANAHIQRDVLTMQALQAPLIAEQTEALEAQLHAMSSLPAEQQLVALGWMDAATAAKAMEINTLAAAVANGELGASGQAAFQSYIEGAVAADPVLKALLIDMGLISEGADGTITIDFSSAEGAQSEISMLTDSINALILTLGGIPPFYLDVEGMEGLQDAIKTAEEGAAIIEALNPILTIDGEDHAIPVMEGVKAVSDALDGTVATTYTETIDNSSGIIGAVQSALNALDGRVATSRIRTIYETIGSPPGQSAYDGLAHGGIAEYAMGGNVVPIFASENGTELAHFPTGGVVPLVGKGVHHVPAGTYIETAPSARSSLDGAGGIVLHMPIHGNVYGMDDLEEKVADRVAEAVGKAARRRQRALGLAS